MGLTAQPVRADGKRKDQVQYGIDFLYKNRRDADTILFAARSANILLTLLFALRGGLVDAAALRAGGRDWRRPPCARSTRT